MMWEGIELRELRTFLTLAEELHFRRTADRLQLTPSRVSQTIRELETKLGAQLVHRTSRRVTLTAFGERFREDVGPALEQLAGVLERSNAAARSLEGTLRVGLFSGPAAGPRLFEAIEAFDVLHPECEVELIQLSWDDPLAQLRSGAVDLMACWLPLEQADLVVGPILDRQPRVVAVAEDHPLAERTSVSLEDLADHRVPRFDGWPKELHDALFPPKTPSGRSIPALRLAVGERNLLELAARVARRELVHPTIASVAPIMAIGHFNLAYIPITGTPAMRSALVWRRRERDPRLREFIRVAKEVLQAPKRGAGVAAG